MIFSGHTQESINSLPDEIKYRLLKRFESGTIGARQQARNAFKIVSMVREIGGMFCKEPPEALEFYDLFPEWIDISPEVVEKEDAEDRLLKRVQASHIRAGSGEELKEFTE